MKPFNLERALAGDEIQTRDGRVAKFIAHIADTDPNYRVVALLAGEREVRQYSEIGGWSNSGDADYRDLFMAPKKRTIYVNIYPKTLRVETAWHETASDAMEASSMWAAEAIARAVPVEIEE